MVSHLFIRFVAPREGLAAISEISSLDARGGSCSLKRKPTSLVFTLPNGTPRL